MLPSMSRPANPYDNACCESFMKTLKQEEVYANTYRDLDHLRANIAAFIEQYYNRVRLHSALGYHSPEEFEDAASSTTPVTDRSHHAVFQASSTCSSCLISERSGYSNRSGGEEHHSINHHVCSFLCLTGGVHPNNCAQIVLTPTSH